MRSSTRARTLAGLAALAAAVALLLIGARLDGRDHRPLVWGLQAELAGGSAYGPELAARLAANYAGDCAGCAAAGFAYPLPAVWLALPIAALPDTAAQALWCLLGVGSVLIGLRLLGMPLLWLGYAPLVAGVIVQQVTVLLVGLLLIGVWAWRGRRWPALAALVALTVAAKPQTSLVLAVALAALMVRAGAWRPLALGLAALLGLTALLDPLWPYHWWLSISQYSGAISSTMLWAWLPVAGVLLAIGQPWAALAVLQVALFPIGWEYALLPLLIGYVDLRAPLLVLLAVGLSWVVAVPVAPLPFWLAWGLALLVPLLLGPWLVRRWSAAPRGPR